MSNSDNNDGAWLGLGPSMLNLKDGQSGSSERELARAIFQVPHETGVDDFALGLVSDAHPLRPATDGSNSDAAPFHGLPAPSFSIAQSHIAPPIEAAPLFSDDPIPFAMSSPPSFAFSASSSEPALAFPLQTTRPSAMAIDAPSASAPLQQTHAAQPDMEIAPVLPQAAPQPAAASESSPAPSAPCSPVVAQSSCPGSLISARLRHSASAPGKICEMCAGTEITVDEPRCLAVSVVALAGVKFQKASGFYSIVRLGNAKHSVLLFDTAEAAAAARVVLNIADPPRQCAFKFCSMHQRFHLSSLFPNKTARTCTYRAPSVTAPTTAWIVSRNKLMLTNRSPTLKITFPANAITPKTLHDLLLTVRYSGGETRVLPPLPSAKGERAKYQRKEVGYRVNFSSRSLVVHFPTPRNVEKLALAPASASAAAQHETKRSSNPAASAPVPVSVPVSVPFNVSVSASRSTQIASPDRSPSPALTGPVSPVSDDSHDALSSPFDMDSASSPSSPISTADSVSPEREQDEMPWEPTSAVSQQHDTLHLAQQPNLLTPSTHSVSFSAPFAAAVPMETHTNSREKKATAVPLVFTISMQGTVLFQTTLSYYTTCKRLTRAKSGGPKTKKREKKSSDSDNHGSRDRARDLLSQSAAKGRGSKRRASRDLTAPTGRSVGGARTRTLADGTELCENAGTEADAQTHTPPVTAAADVNVNDFNVSEKVTIHIDDSDSAATNGTALPTEEPDKDKLGSLPPGTAAFDVASPTRPLATETPFVLPFRVRLGQATHITAQMFFFAFALFLLACFPALLAQALCDLDFQIMLNGPDIGGFFNSLSFATKLRVALFYILIEGLSQDCMPLFVSLFVFYMVKPRHAGDPVSESESMVRMPRRTFRMLLLANAIVPLELLQRALVMYYSAFDAQTKYQIFIFCAIALCNGIWMIWVIHSNTSTHASASTAMSQGHTHTHTHTHNRKALIQLAVCVFVLLAWGYSSVQVFYTFVTGPFANTAFIGTWQQTIFPILVAPAAALIYNVVARLTGFVLLASHPQYKENLWFFLWIMHLLISACSRAMISGLQTASQVTTSALLTGVIELISRLTVSLRDTVFYRLLCIKCRAPSHTIHSIVHANASCVFRIDVILSTIISEYVATCAANLCIAIIRIKLFGSPVGESIVFSIWNLAIQLTILIAVDIIWVTVWDHKQQFSLRGRWLDMWNVNKMRIFAFTAPTLAAAALFFAPTFDRVFYAQVTGTTPWGHGFPFAH